MLYFFVRTFLFGLSISNSLSLVEFLEPHHVSTTIYIFMYTKDHIFKSDIYRTGLNLIPIEVDKAVAVFIWMLENTDDT